jgi:hypothetical protein
VAIVAFCPHGTIEYDSIATSELHNNFQSENPPADNRNVDSVESSDRVGLIAGEHFKEVNADKMPDS